MSAISETAEAIGWHRHGSTWVWGIAEDEGCALCDAASRWLAQQPITLSMEEQLRKALLRRAPPEVRTKSAPAKSPAPLSKRQEAKLEAERRQRGLF